MEDLEVIAVLQDPVRRRLYEYVVAQDHEVSRNEAAEGAGIQRTLAAFHLDKLVDAGLLETVSRRLSGRSGPGAGRPAKLYLRSGAEHQFSVPARDYGVAADLLAEVAEAARLDVELQAAARRKGRAAASRSTASLRRRPCWPLAATSRAWMPTAPSCAWPTAPFHVLSERHPGLVCGMNLALLEGLMEGADGRRTCMDPRPGLCCVVVQSSKDNVD